MPPNSNPAAAAGGVPKNNHGVSDNFLLQKRDGSTPQPRLSQIQIMNMMFQEDKKEEGKVEMYVQKKDP
jgi:hypothetical protein